MLLLSQKSTFADSDLSAGRKPSSDEDIDLLPPPSSWDTSPKLILLFTSMCQHFTGSRWCWILPQAGISAAWRKDLNWSGGDSLFWETAVFFLLGSHFRASVMMCWEHFMNFQFASSFNVLRILCWMSSFSCCYFSTLYSAAQKTAEHLISQPCSIECSSWTPDNHLLSASSMISINPPKK